MAQRSSRLTELRPRTVWDVVDDAFDLYRANFALLAGIAALVLVPGYLAYGAWQANFMLGVGNNTPTDPGAFFGAFLGQTALVFPLFGVAYVLYGGATAAAVEDLLFQRPVSLATAYRRALKRLLPLLGASLIVGLLATVGLCALYVGALVVVTLYAFVAQAVVLERRGALAAGARSREMVSGHFGKVLGLLLLLIVLTWVLTLGLLSLTQLLVYFLPKSPDRAAQQLREMIVSQAAQSLGGVLLAPLGPIATTLQYYDLRVRREGLDMEAQAEATGYDLAPDPFGGVARPKVPRSVTSRPTRRPAP